MATYKQQQTYFSRYSKFVTMLKSKLCLRAVSVKVPSADISFVPSHRPVKTSDIDCFRHFLLNHRKILILTGAGMSTESGLPDYRSELVGLYARSNHKPMQYQEFLKSEDARKRYWARSYLGWPRVNACQPSSAAVAIADHLDVKSNLVTQNVDGLHIKAGSKEVIELHGTVHKVICLQCGDISLRKDLQERLHAMNEDIDTTIGSVRPDGDVDINEGVLKKFKPASCEKCGGSLKPDIVFFGDNVPQERVKSVEKLVFESDSVLVLGSSLTVYSSYRIVTQAHRLKKSVFIINIGPTRCDSFADIKINVKIGELFSKMPYDAYI